MTQQEESLSDALPGGGKRAWLQLILSFAERLFPVYTAFCRLYQVGDVQSLRGVLDDLWSIAENGGTVTSERMGELRARVEGPIDVKAEEYFTPMAWIASNCVECTFYALEVIVWNDPQFVDSAAHCLRTSTADYIRMTMKPLTAKQDFTGLPDEWVQSAPLFQSEVGFIRECGHIVTSVAEPAEACRRLRRLAKSSGIDPARRGLVP